MNPDHEREHWDAKNKAAGKVDAPRRVPRFVNLRICLLRLRDTRNRLLKEVNDLRNGMELGQENCDALYNDLREERDEYKGRFETALEGKRAAEQEAQRLRDLVRHQRSDLHIANLITDEEYVALVSDHGAVARLNSYNDVRRRLARAERDLVIEKLARKAEDGRYNSACANLDAAAKQIEGLERERERDEARKDTERLDFLNKQGRPCCVRDDEDPFFEWHIMGPSQCDHIRVALDAARKEMGK